MTTQLRMTTLCAGATALAALALAPLFDSLSWYPSVLAVIAVVAAVGMLGRKYSIPAALIPIMQGLSVIVVSVWWLASSHLWLGIVPTLRSVSDLQILIHAGVVQLSSYAAPVPVTAGLTTLATLGVGLVALIVDCLAITLGAPALAGIPLVAFSVTTTSVLLTRTPWYSFVPGAIGWLLLMAADARTSTLNWAGGMTTGPDAKVDSRTTGAAVQVGIAALAIGLIMPLVIPGISTPMTLPAGLQVFGTGGSGGNGLGGAVAINPLVSLKRDYLDKGDRELLTVTSAATAAPYLRLIGLDQFDGTSWTASSMSPALQFELQSGQSVPLARPAGSLTQLAATDYTVRVSALDDHYLPIPYPPKSQTIGAGWYVDPGTDTVFSQQFSTANRTYSVTAAPAALSATTMRGLAKSQANSPDHPDTPLASSVPTSIAQTARSVTAGADNSFDAAIALQSWFRNSFRYSTDVKSGNDTAYLQQFLNDRVGYCEQFAATMALMAQSLGIPARVAVGFAPGRATSATTSTTTWTVSSHDAHAWPELWIPGNGWTRFEPTPRTSSGATIASFSTAPTAARPTPSSSASRSAAPSARPQRPADSATTPAAADSSSDLLGRAMWLIVMVGLAALAIMAAIPALVRWRTRRRRLSAPSSTLLAQGAWQELRDTMVDYGGVWDETQTPRQAARQIASSALPRSAVEAVGRILRAAETSLYANPATPVVLDRQALQRDLQTIRQALGARDTRRQRWAAKLLPKSVALPWHRLRSEADLENESELHNQRELERV